MMAGNLGEVFTSRSLVLAAELLVQKSCSVSTLSWLHFRRNEPQSVQSHGTLPLVGMKWSTEIHEIMMLSGVPEIGQIRLPGSLTHDSSGDLLKVWKCCSPVICSLICRSLWTFWVRIWNVWDLSGNSYSVRRTAVLHKHNSLFYKQ